ncbi:hypothetical protein FPQ18DRAFT_312236 [Pyronema domesticum]|uniref:Similar to Uncharacterized FAD-linked oxidoreductase ygaK acc. no. Q796Y5 n=1 Tax=Pyronema omphalodes (strain CBS 100304) TaxID=1076935 RepID=U4LG49_PYROM|nr:hypothetical protein FPQ18DRAFT_312236 [Pyronema domesticum]CCX30517.1 Similar to Uncharacterized FAD-linked oxidoreductase ygaK; acc. no. Q796Y5 [Pyronema omphalodes CBS 100304]
MQLIVVLQFLIPLAAAFNARRSALTDCLNAASVPILLTSSPSWQGATKPYNLRLTVNPAVVTIPRTKAEVEEALKCAYSTNTRVSAKSGGHSYSASGLSGNMVMDMVEFQEVSYDASTTIATVGSGVRLGNMATKLFQLGERGIPHGTCSGVGIGGHATLGGFGLDSRLWGLTLDTITSIDAVLANGTAVTASSSQNRDLFWALRGAGPGFAVVTSFKMKTFPAPPVNVNWAYTYVYSTAQKAAKAYSIAQAFGQTDAPKELGYGILFFPGNQFIVRGVYYGPKANMDRILAPLLEQLTSLNDGKAPKAVVNTQGWIASLTELDGTTLQTLVRGYDKHDTFYAKSITTKESAPLSLTALNSMFAYLYTNPAPPNTWWMIISNLYGGPGSVINSFPPSTDPASTSSYADRDSGYVLQFYGSTASTRPPFNNQIMTYVKSMVGSLGDEVKNLPAYAPYNDPELTRAEAQQKYWGAGVPRLKAIKSQVDPKGILYNPQGF